MKKNDIRCSFCGKEKERTNKLIAGPNDIYICDECVYLCVDMLEQNSDRDNRHDIRNDYDWNTMLDKLNQVQIQVSDAIKLINEGIKYSRKGSQKPHSQN